MTNRMTTRIDEPESAEVFDDALRWSIPSRSDPHETHLVELGDAPGYDVCDCLWFQTTLGPLLARGVSPGEAAAQGLVKLKKGERVEDALKCWHIREANHRFGLSCKRAMVAAHRLQERNAKNRSHSQC